MPALIMAVMAALIRLWKNWRPIARALALAGTLLLIATPNAFAIVCEGPDHWFLTRVALTSDRLDLPPGVGVSVRESPRHTIRSSPIPGDGSRLNSVASYAALNRLVITNTTETPLHKIVDMSEFHRDMRNRSAPSESLRVDLEPGLAPMQKIQGGTAYTWTYWTNDGSGWHTSGSEIHVTDGRFGVSPGFQDRLVRARPRPPDASPPPPQDARVLLVYGDRTYAIPFTVTYVLNPTYDPTKGTGPCGLAGIVVAALTGAVFLGFLGVGGVLIALLVVLLRRWKPARA